jgi:hypothetical protein
VVIFGGNFKNNKWVQKYLGTYLFCCLVLFILCMIHLLFLYVFSRSCWGIYVYSFISWRASMWINVMRKGFFFFFPEFGLFKGNLLMGCIYISHVVAVSA